MVEARFSRGLRRRVARPAVLTNGVTSVLFDALISFQPVFKTIDVNAIALGEGEGVATIDIGRRAEVWQFRWTLYNDSTFPISGKSAYDKFLDLRTLKNTPSTISSGDPSFQVKMLFDYPDGSNRKEEIQGKITSIAPLNIIYGTHREFIDGDLSISFDDLSEQLP